MNAPLTAQLEARIAEQKARGGKKCMRCEKWKPLYFYNKDRSQPDKLRVYCKACSREFQRLSLAKTRTKITS